MAGVALAVLLENLTLTPVLCFQKRIRTHKIQSGRRRSIQKPISEM